MRDEVRELLGRAAGHVQRQAARGHADLTLLAHGAEVGGAEEGGPGLALAPVAAVCEKVAFVGKNGQGKSTLIKAIMGEIDFDGKLQLGHNSLVGYFAQNQASLLDEGYYRF